MGNIVGRMAGADLFFIVSTVVGEVGASLFPTFRIIDGLSGEFSLPVDDSGDGVACVLTWLAVRIQSIFPRCVPVKLSDRFLNTALFAAFYCGN